MTLSATLRESAELAARAAGAVALEGFRNPDLVAVEKADKHDLVTEYDGRSEETVRGILLERHPGSAVLGEEGGVVGADGATLVWHVDPIDGTAAYATGLALWCVCIGAELDGRIVAGVVYDPVADQLFSADEHGAYLGDRRLTAQGRTTPDRATVISHFPWPRDLVWDADDAMERFRQMTGDFATVRCIGSGAMGMCYLAAGWADAVLNLGANSWDVAAGAFILRQAGGEYVAYADGEAVDPVQDHYCGNYVGTVAGAEFPTLHELVRYQSGRDGARAAQGQAARIELEGAYNFRDLGGTATPGGRLRQGWFYRADALNALTDADVAQLGELGIGLVVDLREGVERSSNPDRIDGIGARHLSVPLHDDQLMNERGTWQPEQSEQYRLYAERFGHRIAEAVGEVLVAESPVVIHCTAGKDRTGVVVAILLELLGAPRSTIEADYLVSYEFLAKSPFWDRVSADYRKAGLPQYALDEAKGVPRGSIVVEVLDALVERHGSLPEFLAAHGVQDSAIVEFKKRMIVR